MVAHALSGVEPGTASQPAMFATIPQRVIILAIKLYALCGSR